METIAIGVDIGGSHISCAACDMSEKKYLGETLSESELDNQGTAPEIISVWARTILETLEKISTKKITGIGFAMPGPFDYVKGTGLFKGNNKKYENIYGLNVPHALREKMNLSGNVPIRFINDATAFALGEDWLGKAAGTRNSLSITLGTGFGSAFLSDHLPVVTGDQVPEMGCVWYLPFKNGSADDYFSTRGLLNRYHEKTGKTLSGVKELAALVHEDPFIQLSGTEALVIGGNISNAFNLFGKSLKEYFAVQGVKIRIAVSGLKETASIIGSALLADDSYYKKLLPVLAHM
jgi:glucokinase